MLVFKTIKKIQSHIHELKASGKKIGFVPTMGALHNGHLSLVNESLKDNDITICSIYVNPTQFNDQEDLYKYPKNHEGDIEMLKKAGCDMVFIPSDKEMYPQKPSIKISFGPIEQALEGKFRPGHFAGVGLIVSKLFHIISPGKAYFGQKDLQQFYIIKKLVDELGFSVDLVQVPTVREENGLAMSSRNERLTKEERGQAALLYQSLSKGKELLLSGQTVHDTRSFVVKKFDGVSSVTLEYFEIIETKHFQSIESIGSYDEVALCIAATIGKVRLIDNLLLFS